MFGLGLRVRRRDRGDTIAYYGARAALLRRLVSVIKEVTFPLVFHDPSPVHRVYRRVATRASLGVVKSEHPLGKIPWENTWGKHGKTEKHPTRTPGERKPAAAGQKEGAGAERATRSRRCKFRSNRSEEAVGVGVGSRAVGKAGREISLATARGRLSTDTPMHTLAPHMPRALHVSRLPNWTSNYTVLSGSE